MKQADYLAIMSYVDISAIDCAHDREHVLRVFCNAMEIASTEKDVDMDILAAACLLHDIGRPEEAADPTVCHAQIGAERAYGLLLQLGWPQEKAQAVRTAIAAHRFRSTCPPESLEAKILFDADKLEVTGVLGIARTLQYGGQTGEPLYTLGPGDLPGDGSPGEPPSFLREYQYKLRRLYSQFYTAHGRAMALERQAAAQRFYDDLLREIRRSRGDIAALAAPLLTE